MRYAVCGMRYAVRATGRAHTGLRNRTLGNPLHDECLLRFSRCPVNAVAAAGLLSPQRFSRRRSRVTAPATTRAQPAAILGLRRCTARATRGTQVQVVRASPATAPTVSRRELRRPDRTPRTIPRPRKQG